MTGYRQAQLQRVYDALLVVGGVGLTRAEVQKLLGLKNGTQTHELMLELAALGYCTFGRSPDLPRAPMVYVAVSPDWGKV
jgi:chromosome segregation and condensation protein ScpB